MSVYKYFVNDVSKKSAIDEFLSWELRKAGYSQVEISKTPMGARVVIFAAKPGIVIGRRGQSVRDLTKTLEEKFGLENPQISIASVELPELDAKIMSTQIAMALERGVHFRRAAYWAMGRIMDAGAIGVEVTISGKLTTQRSRSETYRQGYLLKVGDQVKKQIQTSTAHCQLKPGLFGVRVSIMPPNFDFVDRPSIKRVTTPPDTDTKTVEHALEVKKEERVEKGEEVENANSEKAGDQATTA
jgi:small subunit ribosomal protein S3